MILNNISISKKCTRCSVDLPLSLFSKCNDLTKSKDGFQSSCKPCMKTYQQNRYKNKKEQINQNNREKRIKSTSNYTNERVKSDPLFKLMRYLRSRTLRTLKSKKMHKTSSFKEYIGCTPNQLRDHVEVQFKKGMNWENQGKWHIDHKIPLSSAKTANELYRLCHYSNLQPLWAHENLTKSDKVA